MEGKLFKSTEPIEYYTERGIQHGFIEGEFIKLITPGRMLMMGLMFNFEISCETFARFNKFKSDLVKQVTEEDILTMAPGQFQYNVFGELKEITEIFHVGRSNTNDAYFVCMYQAFGEDGTSKMSHTIREFEYILWYYNAPKERPRYAYISEIGNMVFLNFYNSSSVYNIKGFDTVRKAKNYANKYGYTLTEKKPSLIKEYENVD